MFQRLLLVSVLCLGQFGCEQPSPEISAMIARPLGEGVSMYLKGIEYEVEGTTIKAGGRRLEVLPYAERCGVRDSEHHCGVRFDIHADGVKDERLSFHVLGQGGAPEEAQRDAVRRWWVAFAFPLIRSLADRQTEFGRSRYAAYPGPTVVRGKPPGGWLDGSATMHRRFTTVLTAFVGDNPIVKSIDLSVTVNGDGSVNGACRVNGVVSPEAFRELRKLPWPGGDPDAGYQLYQTYVLKHVSES